MKYTEEEMKRIKDLSMKNDKLFNMVFRGNKELVKKFIEVLEGVELPNDYTSITQDDQRVNLNKKIVLDLKFETLNFCSIVEMQQSKYDFPPERVDSILSIVYANLLNSGEPFNKYPYLHLHVLCTYDLFGDDKYKEIVKQFVESKLEYKYNSRIKVIFHNISSKKLPNNLYGDCCRFMYDNTLSDHPFILELNDIVNKIKTQEETLMDLNVLLSQEYWRERAIRMEAKEEGIQQGIEEGIQQGIEQGIEQANHDLLCNMILKLKNKGYTRDETCDFVKDTVELSK
ncbi:MAG: hypothetical protein R3Y05_06745, partial [bacterium]